MDMFMIKQYKGAVVKILLVLIIVAILIHYFANDDPKILNCQSNEGKNNKYASSVYMSSMERTVILAFLDKSHVMLEYGSGYSTLYYSQFVKAYYSIEHDRQWHKKLDQMIRNSPNISSKISKYVVVPVEPGYRGWRAFDEGTAHQFEDYIKAVRTLNVSKFDRVLIDGRARTACMQEVHRYLHKGSLVFIHDFTYRPYRYNISQKHYALLLQTFEGQTIAIYKPIL